MGQSVFIEAAHGYVILGDEEIYYIGMISATEWIIHRFEIVRSNINISDRDNARHFFGEEWN